MFWIDFASYPVFLNLTVFTLAAAIVWLVGSRLSVYSAIIAHRTGLGEVFVGGLLLAVATSLPETGRTITASLLGDAALGVNSLLGGIVMQTAILGVADLAVIRLALTYFAPRPVLLLEGTMVVLLLGFLLAGLAAGEMVEFFSVGLWTTSLFGLYIVLLIALQTYEVREKWLPVEVPEELKQSDAAREAGWEGRGKGSLFPVALLFVLSAVVLFIVGVVLAEVGEALGAQTGLGGGFVGATLLAFASSLPELSTTVAAVRIGAYSMAISNIFGSNAYLLALVFVADLFYRQGPVLHAVGRSAVFLAAIGIITTCVYLVGLIERRNRVILGMGIDSLAVLIIYLLSLVVLYIIR